MVEARRAGQRTAAQAHSEQELSAQLAQEQAAWQLARAGWAAAQDRHWLATADLIQPARAWSAAAYADTDPQAAALARCEERLHTLHPYAIAWHDRLRAEGATPFDTMRDALPLFARPPHARPGGPAPSSQQHPAARRHPPVTSSPR